MRVDWSMTGGGGQAMIANCITPEEALHSTWGGAPEDGWHPRLGETVTLLAFASKPVNSLNEFIPEWSYAELLKAWPKSAVVVRARFNAGLEGEFSDSPTLKGNEGRRKCLSKAEGLEFLRRATASKRKRRS